MTDQGDLFAPPLREGDTDVRFPPNPLDGLVHFLVEVTTERGTRIVRVRCGAVMPKFRTRDRLTGAYGWESVVTCPRCKYHPPLSTDQ